LTPCFAGHTLPIAPPFREGRFTRRKSSATGFRRICAGCEDLWRAYIAAHIPRSFGNFLEQIAIFVSLTVFNGRKSSAKGIDLEFEDNNIKYLVSIKSGPNWGNSSQHQALINNFKVAKKILATSGGISGANIVCVEACCYGIEGRIDWNRLIRFNSGKCAREDA
jgi:hypothetical protein